MRMSVTFTIAMLLVSGAQTDLAARQSRIDGNWMITERSDPFDDTDRSSIATPGDAFRPDRPLALGWACTNSGLIVMLTVGEMKGLAGRVEVRYRFDAHQASDDELWELAVTRTIAFSPLSAVESFTRMALNSATVVVRVIDPADDGGGARMNSFRLVGLAEALKTLPCARSHVAPSSS